MTQAIKLTEEQRRFFRRLDTNGTLKSEFEFTFAGLNEYTTVPFRQSTFDALVRKGALECENGCYWVTNVGRLSFQVLQVVNNGA